MKGFVPTPDAVVDLMVAKLFSRRAPSADDRVLDPGSGRGAFVAGIIRYCKGLQIPAPQIVAVESDPAHVAVLNDRFSDVASVEIRESDFLTSAIDEFDYVIGNPPYVSISRLTEDEKTFYRSRFATAVGRFDLYILFFEKALKALRSGGRLVFITPEKFLYVNTAAPLRRLLATYSVDELHHLPEDTFEGLVTYPLVTVVDRREARGEISITDRSGAARCVTGPLPSTSWMPAVRQASSRRDTSGWDPSARETSEIDVAKLSDITHRISCGVATGADAVFVRRNSEIPPELDRFAFPTLSGRDIVSTRLPDPDRSMLVPYRIDGTLLPEHELDALGAYLREPGRQESLLRRTCVRSKPWYAFHETPPLRDIQRPKLLCKDICATPTFVIDRGGSILPRHSTYYIVPTDPAVLDELAEFLNSRHVAEWLNDHCQRAANGFLRIQSHVLKELPLPQSLRPDSEQLTMVPIGNDRRTA